MPGPVGGNRAKNIFAGKTGCFPVQLIELMEPERKIEKWLRAYAKKRRGQTKDSFGLHPATRRLLQDEIARKTPAPEEDDDSLSLWEMLRQQSAWLLVFTACIFLVATIFMPVVYKAKEKAQNTLGIANLKQIGAAVQMSAAQNNGQLPASLDELTNVYLAKENLSDQESGKPYVYTGRGENLKTLPGNSVVAYSPEDKDTRAVLFANGRTEVVSRKKFEEVTNADLSQAVAMNNLAPQPESSPSVERESANAGNEPSPAIASQPTVQMPEAGPMSEPPPPPPTTVTAAPQPNSVSGSQPVATAAPGASPISAAPEEQPQPTSASSDLAMNSASAPPPTMALPPSTVGGTFNSSVTHEEVESPVAKAAAQREYVSELQNAFQNSVAPSQTLPVLSNFQVRQNGNALRIIDQDGSVYVGSWRLANQVANNGVIQKQRLQNSDNQSTAKTPQTSAPPALALSDNLQAAQNYIFRVHGMNRTLKKSVVFTGSLLANYVLSENVQQSFGGGIAGTYKNEQQLKFELTNQIAQLPWSNLRITGTAVINRTNHIEVNATPASPAKQN